MRDEPLLRTTVVCAEAVSRLALLPVFIPLAQDGMIVSLTPLPVWNDHY
jgi:hypothetical protein